MTAIDYKNKIRPSARLPVLHVVSHMDRGGLERVVATLASQLDPRRFDVKVLCLAHNGVEGLPLGDRVVVAPVQSRFSLVYPRQLVAMIRRLGPAIVHCHSGVWLKAARASAIASVTSVIYTEHGRSAPDPWTTRALDHWASRYTEVVVPVAVDLAEYMAKRVVRGGVRIEAIKNGTDVKRFRPDPNVRSASRASLGIGQETFVIGSAGRLVHVKDYTTMLRAFEIFSRDGTEDSLLLIAGEGDEEDKLRALAKDLKVQDRVSFLGWRTDLEDVYPALDIFSLSSISEGTSVGLLESMSSGVPPVVTRVGGNANVLGQELLPEGLVPPGDARALAEKWLRLFTHREQRLAMGAKARARIKENFSSETMVSAYEALYETTRAARRQAESATDSTPRRGR